MNHPETIEITVNGEKIIINKDDLPLWTDKIDKQEEKQKRTRKPKEVE